VVAAAGQRPPTFLNINPSWSPDGQWLVFQSDRHGPAELSVIAADGTGEHRLTWNNANDTHPAWSPGGAWIVFDSDRDGTWNLYAIRPDGTGEYRLTHPGAARGEQFARHPSWSPDGRRIAFDSDRDGDEEVYVMDAGGGHPARLTRSPGRDGPAVWTADGQLYPFLDATSRPQGTPSCAAERHCGWFLADLVRNAVAPDGQAWSIRHADRGQTAVARPPAGNATMPPRLVSNAREVKPNTHHVWPRKHCEDHPFHDLAGDHRTVVRSRGSSAVGIAGVPHGSGYRAALHRGAGRD
jgi:dipeptidyl aminopeptidase/acylaminoacyl peptidase